MGAKLQRAKTMPKLEKLISDKKSPSFRETVDRIRSTDQSPGK